MMAWTSDQGFADPALGAAPDTASVAVRDVVATALGDGNAVLLLPPITPAWSRSAKIPPTAVISAAVAVIIPGSDRHHPGGVSFSAIAFPHFDWAECDSTGRLRPLHRRRLPFHGRALISPYALHLLPPPQSGRASLRASLTPKA